MEDQTTPTTTEPTQTEPAPQPAADWDAVSQKIADAIASKQATYQTVAATKGSVTGEFRVVHEMTTGDLLISFLLICVLALQLLQWVFRAVWGR